MPLLQSKECLTHSQCFLFGSCIFCSLLIASTDSTLRPKFTITCQHYMCWVLSLSSKIHGVQESWCFSMLPEPSDSRKTCIAFIERKEVYSSFFLRWCPSFSDQWFWPCEDFVIPSQFRDYLIHTRMRESCLPFSPFCKNMGCFAGLRHLLTVRASCTVGRYWRWKEKAWVWILSPVFIRQAISLLSTSVFSKCEVREHPEDHPHF